MPELRHEEHGPALGAAERADLLAQLAMREFEYNLKGATAWTRARMAYHMAHYRPMRAALHALGFAEADAIADAFEAKALKFYEEAHAQAARAEDGNPLAKTPAPPPPDPVLRGGLTLEQWRQKMMGEGVGDSDDSDDSSTHMGPSLS